MAERENGPIDPLAFATGSRAKRTFENRYTLPRQHPKPPAHRVKYARAAELARDLGKHIGAGETIHAILSGTFEYGDLFPTLAAENGVVFEDITLSTLSMSPHNVETFSVMMEQGLLGTLNIVISDYWWSHNRHVAKDVYEALDIDDRFQLAVAGIHTKVALVRTAKRKLVIHGSANLRSSRSLEVITIETNPELYDFHMEWHRAILDEHGTVNKPMRSKRLFDHLTR